ncbi:GNAT family N-acetyltransferase [Ruminococcus flavefaciens]|uniref:GNAT family N-acetyltransferase n=1 Tax=Ruminococcus flavefaciens TaxID=1265 RepID=UPI0026EDA6E5|nr:GNAT family N-acetyltransferase [Ruminococcus flavefaciens]MDD7516502.1 GNAT family N-acetyltransferase [Ruminococcus flavefaciens]MDY5690776.1 GNAT family N-acetyltransferase [Ruminococcus flavefaciens]
MKHSGTFNIDTPRLILRRFETDDLETMHKNWASDPAVQTEYGEPAYATAAEAQKLLEQYISGYSSDSFYRWAIIDRTSGENIGQIAFCRVYEELRTAEIEYCIGTAFQGHGYAGEALSAVIENIFRCTDFQRLEAYHRAENTKSGRVLEKSSMHVTNNVERFRQQGLSPEGEVCYCIERI